MTRNKAKLIKKVMTGPFGKIFKLTVPTQNRPYLSRPSHQIVTNTAFVPPHDHCVVSVVSDIADWIEQQPIHMWKPAECLEAGWTGYEYVISSKLYIWMVLRWSA